jgi:glycosyltransferase involved in cell wall biosynthesis
VKHVVFAHRKLSFGGGERVLIEQVAALAGLPVRVSLLFRKFPGQRDIEPELRERNPNLGEVLHMPGPIGSFRWLRATKPDLLVLCNHKGVQRALPWLALTGFRVPTVVTLHEHYERHLRKYRGIRNLADRWIITWNFEQAVRAELGPQPCSLIHPLYPRPAATMATEEERHVARRTLKIPEDALVVGYVGQIDDRKDPFSTLALAERLQEKLDRPLHLLLAGRVDKHCETALQQAVQRSPLRERTRVTGPLPSIGPAFAALDLYLMTSRNEGFFPLALIEALEKGVPLLVPSVGGISTVLQDGEGGFLIRKDDDRQSIAPELLEQAAKRVAPLLADTTGWALQRVKAHALGTGLTRDYDAAARFREALSAWL